MSGRHRTAFACVRPPGHHSGVKGLLHDAPSCGFCLLNSVAVAALHALSTHGDRIKKVAIVDFDVHHGNGTEDIVRALGRPDQLFFSSLHLWGTSLDVRSGLLLLRRPPASATHSCMAPRTQMANSTLARVIMMI